MPGGPLLQDAVAIQELLSGSKGRLVHLPGRRNQAEVGPELGVQRVCIVPNHFKPAAPGRFLGSESADNDVAAATRRANHLADIGPPVGLCGQKMKNRAIVPHIVGRGFELCLRDVGDQPMYALRRVPQSLLAGFYGRLRNIENGKVGASASEQVVNQRGLPPPTSIMDADDPAPAC